MSKKEKNKICPICNNKLGFLKHEFNDGIRICSNCFNSSGIPLAELVERGQTNIKVKEIEERIKASQNANVEIEQELEQFVITKQIGNFVAFDEEKEQWALLSSFLGKVKEVYNYSDIVNFELLEDGNSVASGGLGRALVGGILFGGAGAIVGGVTGRKKTKGVCSSLRLKVTIDNMANPVVYINFIETKMKKDGFSYKTIAESAQECLSSFQLICDRQKKGKSIEQHKSNSSADEILKYKNLLDAGAITEDEYNSKKKELLGL